MRFDDRAPSWLPPFQESGLLILPSSKRQEQFHNRIEVMVAPNSHYPDVHQDDTLKRDLSLSSTFSLAFAFISPIVALYSIFGLGIAEIGPAFWWGLIIAMAGQLLVALAFAMLVSRFPFEGSIYQWSKHLLGHRYGWFAGWTYICTLPITMAAVALGGADFLAQLLGLDPDSKVVGVSLALGLIAFATWGNTQGRRIFATIVWLCIGAEIIGSVGVGVLLLAKFQVNPLSIIWPSAELFTSDGSLDGLFSSKAALAIAYCGWAFLGFESAGAVAEEVRRPERAVPKAMLLCLLSVGGIVAFSALSLILALPSLDIPTGSDPVADILVHHLGPLAYKGMLVLFVIGFVACMLGIQASVSRVIWAFARDRSLPGHPWLGKLSEGDALPTNAIVLTGVLASLLFLLSFTNIYSLLLSFTISGFYIAFAFPLVAACHSALSGTWVNGPFNLGRLSVPLLFAATLWTLFEVVNISWPRSPQLPWYENWAVPLMVGVLSIIGLLIYKSVSAGRRPDALGVVQG
ncbi:amino acid permease [Pseudomonas aeruginosa]|nr:amino acid permease [Pseudomonas aeruginosa]